MGLSGSGTAEVCRFTNRKRRSRDDSAGLKLMREQKIGR
jgi:hypothetical protein